MNRLCAALFSGFVILLAGCTMPLAKETAADAQGHAAHEDHSGADKDGPFPETTDEIADVEAALARAQAAQSHLLLIIGANWCHDSEALIEHLAKPEVAALIDKHYEVQLINVGWFERGFDVAQRFGLAIYTHTPTLLIIEPNTERVLNAHDQHIFRDADKMKTAEVETYLRAKTEAAGWTDAVPEKIAQDPAYQKLIAEILAFEQQQAARIRGGYEILGPKLEADTDDLMTSWRPVRGLRYSLPDDLLVLRNEARDRVAAGETNIALTYPEYPAFPWE